MKQCLLIALLTAGVAFAQPTNYRMPTPNQTTNPVLVHAQDHDTSRLLMMTRSLYASSLGHYTSTDNGISWSGSNTVPQNSVGGNNPWVAFDNRSGYAYATSISHFARSTNWGVDWDTTLPSSVSWLNDETCIAVDNGEHSSFQGRVYAMSGWGLSVSTDSGKTFHAAPSQPFGASLFPLVAVDGYGRVYCFADGNPIARKRSTDGGSTWDTISIPSSFVSFSGSFRAMSVAASTVDGYVCLASTFGDSIKILWTNGPDSGWHESSIPKSITPWYPQMPCIAVDSLHRTFVAFYYEDYGDTIHYLGHKDELWQVRLAGTEDGGQTWGIAAVSDTFRVASDVDTFLSENQGTGINFGIAMIDDGHVGVAWADNRADHKHVNDSMHIYFANVPVGTVFRNSFDTDHLFTVSFFPQSDTSTKHSAVPSEHHILQTGVDYYARPDSVRHDNVGSLSSNNFMFGVWNPTKPLPDTSFTHSFPSTGAMADVQEAQFVHIDSLTCTLNLEGATSDSVKWGIGISPSLNKASWSPLAMDTALRYFDGSTKLYSFKPKDTVFTALGTTWRCEDRWVMNDTLLSNVTSSLSNVQLTGPTNLLVQFKGEMRSDRAFLYNNQRKLCWDDTGKRFWMCYASHGNIYLTYSTDSASTPRGCLWAVEKRINSDYGKCTNPSLAWLPAPTSDSAHTKRTSKGAIVVTWEDTTLNGSVIIRQKQVSMFNRYGNVIGGMDNVSLPFESDSFQFPSAPMVCRVATYPDTGIHGTYYADAAIVWCDNTSAVVCLLNRYCSPLPAVNYIERIPNTGGARLAAIEPGFNRAGGGRSDAVDFNISMHDTNGNVKYIYASLNCTPCGATKLCYSTPDTVWDSIPGGMNTNVSMAVSDSAEPFYAWEQSGTVVAIKLHNPLCDTIRTDHDTTISCWLPEFKVVSRKGLVTRMKSNHSSSNWGGMVARMAYDTLNAPGVWFYAVPPYVSPNVAIYKDHPASATIYFSKQTYYTDSVQSFMENLSPSAGNRLVPDSMVNTEKNGSGRTPIISNGRIVSSSQNRGIWIKDSASTENIHRGGMCDATNNTMPDGGFANKSLHVRLNDSAHFEYHVGEMAIIDPSTGAKAIQHKPMNMTTPITSKADAVAQMKSEYFHVASDSVKIVSFVTPMVNDSGKAIGGLGSTGVLQFKFCLYDSSTGSLLQSLSMTQFSGAGTHVSGVIGADTQIVTGQNGKTCYLQMSVDTSSISSSISFVPVLEITAQKLSDLINSTTGGMAKALSAERGRGGEGIALPNPLNLMIGPNPTSTSAHIMYTIPVDDADQVVEVLVVGMRGNDVKKIFHDIQPEGKYSVTFDGTNLPTGNYIVAVHTKNHQASKLIGIVR